MTPGVTAIDVLVERLRGAATTGDGKEPPVAILWPDPTGQWRGAQEALRARMPELIELGPYAPALRRGPALWVRCVIEGSLPCEPGTERGEGGEGPGSRPVVLYLPGVARQQLRAGDECPAELQPLVELVYRGELWVHEGGHEWTVSAFLKSPRALGLDVAADRATQEALLRALREVLVTPLDSLRGRHLEAEDFDRLLTSDVPRDLLRWLAAPTETKAALGAERWGAFVSQLHSQLGFNPDRDGPLAAAHRLLTGGGAWEAVWERFVEAPSAFGGVVAILERAQPTELFQASAKRWPSLNRDAEQELLAKFGDLEGLPHGQACQAVLEMEAGHAPRRDTVWAQLGLAPLARALEPLSRIARSATTPLTGATPDDFASLYERDGWVVDAAMWEAIAAASDAELRKEIAAVVRLLAHPWLDASARELQRVVERTALSAGSANAGAPGVCVLFVDGLRYDVARRLAEVLERRGCSLALGSRWTAFPTVTATCKPFVSPVAALEAATTGTLTSGAASAMGGTMAGDSITGPGEAINFEPVFRSSGRAVDAGSMRVALAARGVQVLLGADSSGPVDSDSRGWCEFGQVDSIGHKFEADLARHLPEQITQIADRVLSLLDAGWSSIRIITDHGWLLMPGGLPRVDLPKRLTATRWSRCAIVNGAAPEGIVTLPWTWNPAVTIATAPGIACFNCTPGYSHGGVSVQECLVPDFVVSRVATRGRGSKTPASISDVTWTKMRCFFECAGDLEGISADLRLGTANGRSIVAAPKPIAGDGTANFVVEDDFEGKDLILVLRDVEGTVVAQRSTRVGVSS